MDQKITVACITAVLAAFAGACQGNQGQTEPGMGEQDQQEQQQQPQVVAPEERPGEAAPGDGQEGRRQEGMGEAAPGDGEEGRRAEGTQGQGTSGPIDAQELTQRPENRVGQRVVVQGKIDEIIGDRGFQMKGEGGGDALLVLGRPSVNPLDDQWDDARVRVTGTLRRMTSAQELERELGWNIESDLEEKLGEQRFVLIANDVQRMQGQQGAQGGQREGAREMEDTTR